MIGGNDVRNEIFPEIFTPLALKVGLGCLLVQCLLCAFFRLYGTGVLSKGGPSYTAHHVIVLPLMVYLVWNGVVQWFLRDGNNKTAENRIVQGSYFSDLVIGIMAWDIPVTILTKELRNGPMMLHHIAMMFTAALSLGVWSDGARLFGYYAPFFFGVTEISTLPLVTMDILKKNDLSAPGWLGPLFAFLFLTVRVLYFPYMSVTRVLPDIKEVSSKGIYPKPLYTMAVLNVVFSLLQLYWGLLVVQALFELIQNGVS